MSSEYRIFFISPPPPRIVAGRRTTQKMRIIGGSNKEIWYSIFFTFWNQNQNLRLAHFCAGTQNRLYCLPVTIERRWFNRNSTNPHSFATRALITASAYFSGLVTVVLPIFALFALNLGLIFELKKRARRNSVLLENSTRRVSNNASIQQNQERRVTFTVCLIVTAFTLTQGPALFAPIWTHFEQVFSKEYYDVYVAANCLQFIGKSLNFVLFCLTSEHFRQRLRFVFRRKSLDVSRYVKRRLTLQHELTRLWFISILFSLYFSKKNESSFAKIFCIFILTTVEMIF